MRITLPSTSFFSAIVFAGKVFTTGITLPWASPFMKDIPANWIISGASLK